MPSCSRSSSSGLSGEAKSAGPPRRLGSCRASTSSNRFLGNELRHRHGCRHVLSYSPGVRPAAQVCGGTSASCQLAAATLAGGWCSSMAPDGEAQHLVAYSTQLAMVEPQVGVVLCIREFDRRLGHLGQSLLGEYWYAPRRDEDIGTFMVVMQVSLRTRSH